jgi:hypothetical protein
LKEQEFGRLEKVPFTFRLTHKVTEVLYTNMSMRLSIDLVRTLWYGSSFKIKVFVKEAQEPSSMDKLTKMHDKYIHLIYNRGLSSSRIILAGRISAVSL